MKNGIKDKPLTDAQRMVLHAVNGQYSDEEIEELRGLLLDFNNRKMQDHLDEVVAQKKYSKVDFENMLTGHLRKTR